MMRFEESIAKILPWVASQHNHAWQLMVAALHGGVLMTKNPNLGCIAKYCVYKGTAKNYIHFLAEKWT